jgi:Fic family protein
VTYTEIKRKNNKKYYYRVRSIRNGEKFSKNRIYLGVDLNNKELKIAEKKADRKLGILESILSDDEIVELKNIKRAYSKLPKKTFNNRYEAFISLFTHDSTAIEGNTLTLRETADLLFEKITPIKNLREINEVLNHKNAIDYILDYDRDITREFIFNIHKIVIQDTLDMELEDQIGRYRDHQVYIRGVEWIPAPPDQVPKDMKTLLSWYTRNKNKLYPVVVATYFHVGFELVHPFVDGNGRVGRLLLNFILHKSGYPMVNIPNIQKSRYYELLNKGQVQGDLRPFLEFIIELLRENKVPF